MNEFDDFASPLGDDASSIWLTDLFGRTRSPGTAEELSSEAAVVDAMARAVAQPPLVVDISARRRRVFSKAAARTAIVAAALLVGTSTAAATGNLPDAAQSAVARASSHFGVDIPDPNEKRRADEHDGSALTTDPATTDPSTAAPPLTLVDDPSSATVASSEVRPTIGDTSSASSNPNRAVSESSDSPDGQQPVPPMAAEPGPDVTGPAKQGLCRAWAAHDSDSPAQQRSTAMKNLQAAADAAGQTVEEFCAETPAPESTPDESSPTSVVDDQEKKDKNNKELDESEKDKSDKDKSDKDKSEKKEKEPKGGG